MTAAPPRVVSPFEGKLLRVLRCFLRHVPLEQALPVVAERAARPAALSRACVELVQDSLAKGCLLFLARAGGWRRERFLRAGRPRDGRLWDRSPPEELALAFSRHTLEFLVWITAQKPGDPDPPLRLPDAELTPADRLLLFLAYDALRDTEAVGPLRGRPAFASHGLLRLAFPDDYAGATAEPDFGPWVDGTGAAILEAVQPWLADRWVRLVRGQAHVGDWQALAALGREQERVLAAFTAAAERANRPDVTRFILRAAGTVLTPDLPAKSFFAGLQGTGPAKLAERVDVHRRALALPRHLERLQSWERRARGVGFLDDGYAVSQVWKADWEQFRGDELTARAQALVRQVEPLKVQ
jgi:FtsH ternary system domain X6